MTSTQRKWKNLENKEYREGYIEAHIDVDLPFQIAALAHSRGLSPWELAREAGIPLTQIKGKSRVTTNSLCKLATYFDVALVVKFASFDEALEWEQSFDPENFTVVPFEEECPIERSAKFSLREPSIGLAEARAEYSLTLLLKEEPIKTAAMEAVLFALGNTPPLRLREI